MATGNKTSSSAIYRVTLFVLIALVIVLSVLIPSLYYANTELLITRIEHQFAAGEIAPADITATHTFFYLDEEATQAAREAAVQATLPVFSFSMRDTEQNLLTIHDAVESKIISSITDRGVAEKVRSFLTELTEDIFTQGVYDEGDLNGVMALGYEEIRVTHPSQAPQGFDEEIVSIDSLLTKESLSEYVYTREQLYDRMGYLSFVNEYLVLLGGIAGESVHYDSLNTSLEREQAENEVKPVMVKIEQGEQLIQKNSLVTEQMMKSVEAMQLIVHRFSTQQVLGRIFFSLIITLASMYSISLTFMHEKRSHQYILLFAIGIIVTLLLTFVMIYSRIAQEISFLDPIMPVFLMPLFLSIMTGKKRAGMISAVAIASYMSLYESASVMTFFFIIAVSFISVYFIRYVSRRLDMIFQWIITIVSSVTVLLIHMMVQGLSVQEVGISIGILILNITFSYLIISFLLPLFELLFNAPTPFRLRELANGGSPVLQGLASHAPGTHAHSLIVAEYAQAAAKAIGAEDLLAYVGGLYHDIGKQEHPEYFIENQREENKHDDLKASLSVAIIKSHVKLGVEKGREAKLPQEVIDIIYQHHGTDVIQIFYQEAMKEAQADKNSAHVTEHEYSYNNEIPQTKEAAIVMIADSVEAASRAVKKPSHKRYETVVRNVVNNKIAGGQLAASRLTMNDLEHITASLTHSITAKNHSRMQYPKDAAEE